MSRDKKMVLSFADQILSSLSNVFVVLAVARVSEVSVFGIATLLLTAVTTALVVARGSFGTPLLLMSGRPHNSVTEEVQSAVGGALLFGLAVGLCIALSGLVTGLTAIALPLALAAPLVLAEDVQRYGAMSNGRPHLALIWDGVWATGSAFILILTWLTPRALSSTTILSAWTVLAGVSFAGLTIAGSFAPRFIGLPCWWRRTAGDRVRFGLEGGVGAVGSLLVTSVGVALIGAAAAAALRGAGTILGPLNVLMSAMPLAVIPEAARKGYGLRDTWRMLARLAIGMSALALLVGSLGLVLPDRIGHQLLGPSWAAVAPILPITGIEYAGLAWVSSVFSALRSQGRSVALLRARVLFTICSIVFSIGAALYWGTVRAMALGLASAGLLVALVLWLSVIRGSDSSRVGA